MTTALEPLLQRVEKPLRYVGGEWNETRREAGPGIVTFALVFPDLYEAAVGSQAIKILYGILNGRSNALAERVFCPADDFASELASRGMDLGSLESGRPLHAFDVVAVSLESVFHWTSVLRILDLGRVPLRAADRANTDPIVIGGGACTFNPEPLADVFDAFVVGEGEEAIREIVAILADTADLPRDERLLALARLPGVYVPRYYLVSYGADGRIRSMSSTRGGVPNRVVRRIVRDLDAGAPLPTRPIVPNMDTGDPRVVLEVSRGCPHGCRFCQVGYTSRPYRERSLSSVKDAALELLAATGRREILLSSLSGTDYSQLSTLVESLHETRAEGANASAPADLQFSLPTVRINDFSVRISRLLEGMRTDRLSLPVEAGSQGLRSRVNKRFSSSDVVRVASRAVASGVRRLHLDLMLGLPEETDDDVRDAGALVREVARHGAEAAGEGFELDVGVATFVPKPFTPFQWQGTLPADEILERQARLREAAAGGDVAPIWHFTEPERTVVEAALSRGDRRVSGALLGAYARGAWLESREGRFDLALWEAAFADCGLDLSEQASRAFGLTEVLPWDFIDIAVRKAFLLREAGLSERKKISSGCYTNLCKNCGSC